MEHLIIYRKRVEQIYHTHFKRAAGVPGFDIRQTALHIAYVFTGYRMKGVAKAFGVCYTSVYTAYHRTMDIRLYNEMLEIYIECCKEYLNQFKRSHRPE